MTVTISYYDTFLKQKTSVVAKLDPASIKTEANFDAIVKMGIKDEIDGILQKHRAELLAKFAVEKAKNKYAYYNMKDSEEITKQVIALSTKY